MTVLSEVSVWSADQLARRRLPRTDVVAETADGPDHWVLESGPFVEYQRTLTVGDRDDGDFDVTETIRYRLAIPVFGWLFAVPVRRALRGRKDSFDYWWAPPDRLDARAATVLGLLCGVAIVSGYLGTVLTQTLTFAADEFGRGNTAQAAVFGAVRFGVLIALVTAAAADRRGRRNLLLATGIGSCVFTVLGGLSPNLWALGGTQLIARGLSTALAILITIVAVEEMPARSRAWAASVLVLAAGLGSGMAVWVLPVADLSIRGWRAIYLVAGLGIFVLIWTGRRLPETQRFVEGTHHEIATDHEARQRRRDRLALLAVSAFLIALFVAPASSFQNDFLKDERGYDATLITLFTVTTSTPIGIGVLVGGHLAETRGRKRVGALGLAIGTVLVATSFFTRGIALWGLTLVGNIVRASAVPALAVYGPELFGTHDRGRSNGLITTTAVVGSALGLVIAGLVSDRLGGELGPALALLAVGPLAVAVLVLTRYPETAGMELEEINPEDI